MKMTHVWMNYILRIKHFPDLCHFTLGYPLLYPNSYPHPQNGPAVNVGVVPCADQAAPFNCFRLASGYILCVHIYIYIYIQAYIDTHDNGYVIHIPI